MAIGGDYSNNNNSNKQSDTTYYSRFKVRSVDGKRSFGFSFWSGLLIVEINDVDTSSGGFKVNALETIRLSPNKAKMLAYELRLLKNYIKESKVDPNRAFGVSSGLGTEVPYIGFSSMNNEDRTIVITIGKINGEGRIVSSQSFPLDNNEYLYALEWKDINTMDVERNQYNHLELDMIIDILDDFGTHMNGALAYSVLDLGRYDQFRMNKKFDQIFDKLGIEKYTGGNRSYNNSGSNNFLSNLASNNRSSNSTSLDDLEDLLDD